MPKRLRALARWAVGAALGSAANGCGDLVYVGAPLACEPGGYNVLSNPRFAREVDFAGLYVAWPDSNPPVPGAVLPWVSSAGEWGEACRSALAPADCLRSVSSAKQPSEACRQDAQRCGPFAVTTSGDAVRIIFERSEFLALLGTIDTASEAITVSAWDMDPIACPDTARQLAGTRASPQDSRWRVETEWENCGVALERFAVTVSAKGETSHRETVELGPSNCAIGRRPFGLQVNHRRADHLGAYFANAARLEAASVVAFHRLARELSALCAPRQLIVAAARSALDEIRHAGVVAQLARRSGAEPWRVDVAPQARRSRFAIALENAVEGCVRETYGALLAQHQAACALDPAVRKAMRMIAQDELRHAELAWRVAAFLDPQLNSAERTQLLAAKRDALTQLLDSASRPELPAHAVRLIGLPSSTLDRQLIASLAELMQAA